MNIYHNHKKVGTIDETKSFEKTEEEILDQKHMQIRLPFEPETKRQYLLAMTFSKYRDYVRFKK